MKMLQKPYKKKFIEKLNTDIFATHRVFNRKVF